MDLLFRGMSASHPGLVRDGNEDAVYAGRRLFVVADGVGGQPAGEVASELVVGALALLDEGAAPDDPLGALREAVEAANRQIAATALAEPERGGMATTVTALLCTPGRVALLHVGDSRAYRLRDGELRQLSTDHTYVQRLVDRGLISQEEAWRHPRRSVVTQAVQGDPINPQADVFTLHAGDRYLLCSDGLSDVVPAEAVVEALTAPADRSQCADRLVKLALAAGAPDNVSVVVVDVTVADAGDAAG